jgi:hypothetical protein
MNSGPGRIALGSFLSCRLETSHPPRLHPPSASTFATPDHLYTLTSNMSEPTKAETDSLFKVLKGQKANKVCRSYSGYICHFRIDEC